MAVWPHFFQIYTVRLDVIEISHMKCLLARLCKTVLLNTCKHICRGLPVTCFCWAGVTRRCPTGLACRLPWEVSGYVAVAWAARLYCTLAACPATARGQPCNSLLSALRGCRYIRRKNSGLKSGIRGINSRFLIHFSPGMTLGFHPFLLQRR